jgi:hypothetical protein
MSTWVLMLTIVLADHSKHDVKVRPMQGWVCHALVKVLPSKLTLVDDQPARIYAQCSLDKE